MSNTDLEKKVLRLSFLGALFCAFLGISFGVALDSEAILLDGFFNLISFFMAWVTLWVSWLLHQPESQLFQFGYRGFVPLINLIKSLLISILSLFAIISAVGAILHGGRPLSSTLAVIYAAIAASVCLFIAVVQLQISKKVRSSLLRVDAVNWMINGLISLTVGLVFSLAIVLQKTSFSWLTPYADPLLVIVLVLVTLPIPLKIIVKSTRQLLLGSPQLDLQQKIRAVFEHSANVFPYEKIWLRTTEISEVLYLHVYWLLPEQCAKLKVEDLDLIRQGIVAALQQEIPTLEADIIFTRDTHWVEEVNRHKSASIVAN